MIVNDITIYFKFGAKFTIQQNDWEGAPCPICMQLVDNKSWRKVADELEKIVNDCYSNEWDEDELDDFIWTEYERIVLEECRVFYYEDMTDTEEMVFEKLTEKQKDKFAEKVLNRIKEEEV